MNYDTQMSNQEWEDCKKILRKKIPQPFFNTFIEPLRPVIVKKESGRISEFALHVPDAKMLHHIQERYLSVICESLELLSIKGQVMLRSDRTTSPSVKNKVKSPPEESDLNLQIHADPFISSAELKSSVTLFSDLAFPGAIAVLSGPTGSGKTMLAKETLNRHIEKGGTYLRLEEFLTQFSLACKNRTVIAWRKKLRSGHLLILDDFQHIKGSAKKSQEEIRNLIDEFVQQNKHLILCSDTAVSKLPLQTDLASRLNTAWTLELVYPSKHARMEILRQGARRRKLKLDALIIERLSEKIPYDVRRIDSVLLRLEHHFQRVPQDQKNFLDVKILDRICSDLYCSTPLNLSPEDILSEVAKTLGVPVEAVKGPARDKHYVLARHLSAYLVFALLDLPLTQIASVIGRKDHTSVIHARKKIEALMERDLFFGRQVEDIRGRLIRHIGT